MKPIKFYLLMFFFVTLSLAGCGEKESPTPSSNTQTEAVSSTPQQAAKPSGENDKMSDANPVVKIETSKGPITLELDAKNAPDTVANFLSYVNDDFYNGTIFHRVIPDFMVQGGGMNPDMSEKSTKAPIKNEANNGLKNVRGTVAMARTNDPHSASSQFFVNVKSNDFLNFRSETPRGWGYAVFGKVTDGMDVVDQIVSVQTGTKGPHQDVPLESITIDKVTVQ